MIVLKEPKLPVFEFHGVEGKALALCYRGLRFEIPLNSETWNSSKLLAPDLVLWFWKKEQLIQKKLVKIQQQQLAVRPLLLRAKFTAPSPRSVDHVVATILWYCSFVRGDVIDKCRLFPNMG